MVVVRRTPPPFAGATILKPPCSLSAAMVNFVSASSGANRSKYLCFCRFGEAPDQLGLVAQIFLGEADALHERVDDARVVLAIEDAEQPLVLRRLARAPAQLVARDAVCRCRLADRSFRFSAALSSR